MLNNHAAYKYGTPYKFTFLIMRFFTNGMVNIQYGPKMLGILYVGLSYKSDTNVEDINPKVMCDDVNI